MPITPTWRARAAAITAREQVGDALHGRRCGTFAQHLDDGVGMADAGQAPGADQALGDKALEERPHVFDEDGIGSHPDGGIAACAADEALVGDDIGMQEEQVEPRQAQALPARFDGLP
jgi:hypothetical protein